MFWACMIRKQKYFLTFQHYFLPLNPLPPFYRPLRKRPFENIVRKGVYAGYQNFLFSTIFSIGFFLRVEKSWDCMVKGLIVTAKFNVLKFGKTKKFVVCLTLYRIIRPFENIMGKEENAGNQHFLLFPQCCLPFT